jgi:hypothetical protein
MSEMTLIGAIVGDNTPNINKGNGDLISIHLILFAVTISK